MKNALIVAAMLLSTAAMAADDFTIKLTAAQLDTIGKGLGFVPFNEAAPLLQNLREQVQAQQPKPQEPAKVEEKK
jgi:hypothetical protein